MVRVTPACDECSDLSMPSILLFGITSLLAFSKMSSFSATLRSLQVFLKGAVVLFVGGVKARSFLRF